MLKNCFYCGIEPSERSYSNTQRSSKVNGIDRLDNDKGYIKENCVTCCKTCNFMKRDLSLADFLAKIKRIDAHLSNS